MAVAITFPHKIVHCYRDRWTLACSVAGDYEINKWERCVLCRAHGEQAGRVQHLGVRPPSDEPVLDLHGLRVSDAVRRATVFLVAEQQRGTVAVRIVTGHGTGALKQAIRSMLASHPAVARVESSLQSDAAVLVVLKPPSRTPRPRSARA